ncbi:MAG TPA: hypothetical protein VLS93_02225 [Anaeromyxobacteraceae bacterium]|nr:hypothetical protein [Anaeromyxobacteraceae bacterium]
MTARSLLPAVAACLAAWPAAASAQVEFGARVAYAVPFGDVQGPEAASSAPALEDVARIAVPIQVDALYRIGPRLSLGLYVSYAVVRSDFSPEGTGVGCGQGGADCSASQIRVGFQAAFALRLGLLEPWAGAMIGSRR